MYLIYSKLNKKSSLKDIVLKKTKKTQLKRLNTSMFTFRISTLPSLLIKRENK